ncbi:MAG: hypothetical protein R3A80_06190 [Bdellovibrionota bacterium]
MKKILKKILNFMGIEARKKHFSTAEANGIAYYHLDDFNWEHYNTEYREELRLIQQTHTP